VTSKPTAINGALAEVGGVSRTETGGWWVYSEAGSRFVSTRFHAVTAFPAPYSVVVFRVWVAFPSSFGGPI
jgi:hypothetical protein